MKFDALLAILLPKLIEWLQKIDWEALVKKIIEALENLLKQLEEKSS